MLFPIVLLIHIEIIFIWKYYFFKYIRICLHADNRPVNYFIRVCSIYNVCDVNIPVWLVISSSYEDYFVARQVYLSKQIMLLLLLLF